MIEIQINAEPMIGQSPPVGYVVTGLETVSNNGYIRTGIGAGAITKTTIQKRQCDG